MNYSISKMQEKENKIPPLKQGVMYSISTGKNNGVYLPKDISSQNHISLKLLTKQAQQSHKSYVESLKLVQRQKMETKQALNLIEVESFNKKYDFNESYISAVQSSLQDNNGLHKVMRVEFERLKDKIIKQNSQLQELAIPALKALREKIKQHKEEQSASYSKMHRELEKIEQSFALVAGGIKQCDRKLMGSENHFHGDKLYE